MITSSLPSLPLISVIVPVYNAASYLERCFDSLRNQHYSNIEILFVDDCSTDNSAEICDRLCSKDVRFRLIRHTVNQGQGCARMTGIGEAKGEYIGFVDSDDYVEPDFCMVLYETLLKTQADIACCNVYYVFEIGKKQPVFPVSEETLCLSARDALMRLHKKNGIGYSLCDKLFRKDILAKYPMKTELFEDQAVLYKYLSVATRIGLCLKPLYNYIQRDGSTMHRAFSPHREYAVFCLFCKEAEFLMREWGFKDLNTVVRKGVHFLNHISLLPQTDEVTELKEKVMKKMREYDSLPVKSLGLGLYLKRGLLLYHYPLYSAGYRLFMKLFKKEKYRRITGEIIGL